MILTFPPALKYKFMGIDLRIGTNLRKAANQKVFGFDRTCLFLIRKA
jgi:hypothetical protein